MKAIKFDGELTDEATTKFLADIDRYPGDEELVVYFCSNGGSVDNALSIADYVNRNLVDRFTFVVRWQASSSALDLLVALDAKLDIKGSAFTTIHLYTTELDYRSLQERGSVVNFQKQDLEAHNARLLKELETVGLSVAELQRITDGYDVVVSGERFKTLVADLRALRQPGAV